jgi:hypothetical protein
MKPIKTHPVVISLLAGVTPTGDHTLETVAAHYEQRILKKGSTSYLPIKVPLDGAAAKRRGRSYKIALLTLPYGRGFRFSSDFGAISDRDEMYAESISGKLEKN